jgi:hypothetical protein
MNNITLRWDPIGITNVEYYEIQIADNQAFDLPKTHRQRNLQFTYEEGDPDTEYYARVRVKPINKPYGAWSGTLSTTTGIATYTHLEQGAATNVTDNYFDLSGEAALDPYADNGMAAGLWTSTGYYGGTTIRCYGGTVLPYIVFQYSVASTWVLAAAPHREAKVDIEVLRRGDTGEVGVDDVTIGSYSTVGTYNAAVPANSVTARVPSLGLASPDDPGFGVWRYRVKLDVTGDSQGANPSYIRVQPLWLNVEIVELRN